MPKLILLRPRARKRITFTTQKSRQSLFKQNYIYIKESSQKSTDLLILDPKRSLFKTNKTRNATIKNNSDRTERDDGHWPTFAHGGANGGDGRHNTLEGGQKWPKLLHMTEKHVIKHKENKRKTCRKRVGA
jgi:hypothetical protein